MAASREERFTKLVARMPRDVREGVARLEAEIAQLKEHLRKNEAASHSSPVGIIEHTHNANDWRQVHLPLPVDKPIRFYGRNLTAQQRKDSDKYIEVHHERLSRDEQEDKKKRLTVEVKTGFGGLRIIPHSSNIIYITTDRD